MNERVIHVFREPTAAGYGTSLTVKPGQAVACVAVPEASLEVDELFTA